MKRLISGFNYWKNNQLECEKDGTVITFVGTAILLSTVLCIAYLLLFNGNGQWIASFAIK